jgi:hypothetical protein
MTANASNSYDPDCSGCSQCNDPDRDICPDDPDYVNGIKRFYWSFGDGDSNTETCGSQGDGEFDGIAYHTYQSTGTKTVTVTVTDDDGTCRDWVEGCGGDKSDTSEQKTVVVVKMDLNLSVVTDANEELDGAFLAVNDDDDNDNGTQDRLDGSVSGEDDLATMFFSMSPSLASGTVKLEAGPDSSKIRVYEDNSKSTPVTLPKTWNLLSVSLPTKYYIEGYSASGGLKDLTLTFSYCRGACAAHFDTVKVTVIDVDYSEDTNQDYGYDSYTNSFFPYKSVEVGETDTVYADISGTSGVAGKVYFTSTDESYVTVSPSQASSTHQQVTFEGISEEFAQGPAELYDPDTYDIEAASIGVYAYNQDSYTLAFRVIHEDDDDVQEMAPQTSGSSETDVCVSCGANGKRDTIKSGDDVYSGENILVGPDKVCDSVADGTDEQSTCPYTATELKDYLNETIYNQAVFNWTTVDKLDDMDVNFDLNRDGYIDVSSWKTAEMDVVIDQCKNLSYNYNIFIVNNPSDGSCGYMDYGQMYGFVHPDHCTSCVDRTTAHELGHGAFSQNHSAAEDTENLMRDRSCGERLRKGQWEAIQ